MRIKSRQMLEFDWDDANIAHIARHGVSPEEAEQSVTIAPVDLYLQHAEGEDRLYQLGVTARGRILAVATTYRENMIRFVTAFDATAGLKRRYWDERRKLDGE